MWRYLRYHWGRQREDLLEEWNVNLRAIASHQHNIIASNNKYDLEYLKYFTDVQHTHQEPMLLPSFCNYVNASWNPHRPEVLVGTYQMPKGPFYDDLMRANAEWNEVSAMHPLAVQMWQAWAHSRCRCGRRGPTRDADVAGVGPVPAQMWAGWAQSRRRCGQDGPSRGADLGGIR